MFFSLEKKKKSNNNNNKNRSLQSERGNKTAISSLKDQISPTFKLNLIDDDILK
jgi:hypothetical protein